MHKPNGELFDESELLATFDRRLVAALPKLATAKLVINEDGDLCFVDVEPDEGYAKVLV